MSATTFTGSVRSTGSRKLTKQASRLILVAAAIVVLVAVSFFIGRAVYAVGTNVAFRRDAYARSTGFDTGVLVGGDEMALFSALRKIGRTRFDLSLRVDTDGRRTQIGLARFLWEIVLLQYMINYPVYRLTGRTLRRAYQPGSTLR